MSDANRVQIGYIKESTYGITPSGALKTVRMTGETLKQDTDTTTSQEIRADRQTADFIRTGLRANGGVNGEFSFGTYDDWLTYGLFSPDFTTAGSSSPWTGGTYTVAASGVNFTITRTAGTFDFTTLTDHTNGRWIKLAGFSGGLTANNTWVKIMGTPSATVLTTRGAVLTTGTGSTGLSSTVQAEIVAGTTVSSMSMERLYADLSTTLAAYRGMLINGMTMNGTANGIITVAFDFLGKNETSETATIGTSYTPSYGVVTPVMNGISNLEATLENNAAQTLFSFNFQLQNNLRERLEMGTEGPISIATGLIGITGQIVLYFTAARAALATEYLNFTTSTLSMRFVGATGGRYIFDFGALKFSGATRNAGGINQDVYLTMPFTGFLSPTSLDSLRIIKAA